MTLSEAHSNPAGLSAPAPRHGADTRVLATALSHLLRRDEDCPAGWRTAPFAEAVELARNELRCGDTVPSLLAPHVDVSHDLGFRDAVARLARNPRDVAVAVHHLELAERQPLPAWLDLVRRGLPSRPIDLDAALWFG